LNSSALPVELIPPPSDLLIPVEEWDWDEIRRIEDAVHERFRRFPRCERCAALMVLGQIRLHHSCRPPDPALASKRRAKLGGGK
jgi:hypothetical protein